MIQSILKQFQRSGMKFFWGNYFDSRFYIAYLISRRKSDLILDLGCGNGILLYFSNSSLKIGLDFSLESLSNAKKLDPKMELILGDVTYLPFRDRIFPRILAVQILPQLNKLNNDIEKAIKELKRISKENCELILSGNNRRSRHFEHDKPKANPLYLTYQEQHDLLKNDFFITMEGYDPHSKVIMYPIRKILYKIPEKLSEKLMLERFIYWFLKSKRYLKNGRSYVIMCYKKPSNQL